jgi:predicted TIM-barrel fold metal-dependent hydrolase
MPVIDFRARPNTEQYMGMYPDARPWARFFDCPRPKHVSLEAFIQALDETGVSQAVFTGRQTPVNTLSNDYVHECVQAYPDRLFGFAGIDPTMGEAAVREIERTVGELGMKGISIDPHSSKRTPDDDIWHPLYDKCAELGVPVIVTMGPIVGKWAPPVSIDNVAEMFPTLTIVCSHGVWPRVTELIALAYKYENVYLEASIYEFLPGAEPIFEAANTILQDKIIYASGFPFRPLADLQRFLEYPFASEVVEKLVYGNAARVLKIE